MLRPLLLAFFLAVSGAPAFAQGDRDVLSVELDFARVIKLPRPAATVIIGNPAIADVAVQDATTLVLTGRSFGRTNLVVLDGDGKPVIDQDVGVRASESGTVRIYRQAARTTLFCDPECQPTVTVGDIDGVFQGSAAQLAQREAMARGGK